MNIKILNIDRDELSFFLSTKKVNINMIYSKGNNIK